MQVPQTLKEVNLPGRIRAAGGASLKEAGEFFGWDPARITKKAADFTKDQLLVRGWSKERLLHVADGYEHIARITPLNPSAAEPLSYGKSPNCSTEENCNGSA
jgi:hypothetical protein